MDNLSHVKRVAVFLLAFGIIGCAGPQAFADTESASTTESVASQAPTTVDHTAVRNEAVDQLDQRWHQIIDASLNLNVALRKTPLHSGKTVDQLWAEALNAGNNAHAAARNAATTDESFQEANAAYALALKALKSGFAEKIHAAEELTKSRKNELAHLEQELKTITDKSLNGNGSARKRLHNGKTVNGLYDAAMRAIEKAYRTAEDQAAPQEAFQEAKNDSAAAIKAYEDGVNESTQHAH